MQENFTITTVSGFFITRGVNLSHWLSQAICSNRSLYFEEDDLRTIKDLGFDHVRIPIDEHEMWNDDGLIIGRSFLMLKKCLDMCMRNSLKAVVVIKQIRHSSDTVLWNNIIVQDNLLKLWRNLSDFLKDYPRNMLAYEILNEPDAPTDAQWNRLMRDVYAVIRNREPERTIIIGSNCHQSEMTVDKLDLPNDSNIMVSIRFFKPFGLTHYRSEWTALKDYSGPVQYPGYTINPDHLFLSERNDILLNNLIEKEQVLDYWDQQQLRQALKPASDFCKANGVGLYCSQFGCLPTVSEEMRAQYYTDIIACFKQLGIIYSYWDFKGRFGVITCNDCNEYLPDPVIVGNM